MKFRHSIMSAITALYYKMSQTGTSRDRQLLFFSNYGRSVHQSSIMFNSINTDIILRSVCHLAFTQILMYSCTSKCKLLNLIPQKVFEEVRTRQNVLIFHMKSAHLKKVLLWKMSLQNVPTIKTVLTFHKM